MDINDALALSTTNFLSLLDYVTPHDMSRATPCEGWSVHDLLAHVARGSDMAVSLVDGASRADASALLGQGNPDDVVSELRRALAAQLAAMTGESDLEKIVHHPMGDIAVKQLFEFRIADLTLHAWDLARAIDISEDLPDELVEHVYGALLPLESVMGQIGVFGEGPSGTLESESSTQVKLLDLTGRRP
jgi:uncharacterized protein (TIGR03086 family)